MSIEAIDDIYECDGDGVGGSRMGWLLYGAEVTPEDVETFINTDEDVLDATHHEFGNHVGDFEAIECYVRKVPTRDGGWRYAYTGTPGRGARKCVRVEFHSSWGHWCVNHIYEPASTGIPVEQVEDTPWPMVSRGYVHLCRPCATSFRERMDAARAALRRSA